MISEDSGSVESTLPTIAHALPSSLNAEFVAQDALALLLSRLRTAVDAFRVPHELRVREQLLGERSRLSHAPTATAIGIETLGRIRTHLRSVERVTHETPNLTEFGQLAGLQVRTPVELLREERAPQRQECQVVLERLCPLGCLHIEPFGTYNYNCANQRNMHSF